MTGSSTTLHERLRDATAASHRAAERSFDLDNAAATIDGYRNALVRLWKIHNAVELALLDIDWGETIVGLPERQQKLDWLDADLNSVPPGPSPSAPLSRDEPPLSLSLSSLGEGLGCLYVIEGATLGGRIIYDRVAASLGLTESHGARYFFGYGPRTEEMWSSFLAILGRFEAGSAIGDAALAGAHRTFSLFGR